MQKFSNPISYCSTAIGRSLLGWYCTMENYICFLSAYKAVLPAEWRKANIRIRQQLAHEDYPQLAPSDRKPRLLDDLWPQYSAILLELADVVATLPELKKLDGQKRVKTAALVEAKMRQFTKDFKGFVKSPHVVEITQSISPHDILSLSKHTTCCPSPPFTPIICHFPPAATFLLSLHISECYIRSAVYPALRHYIREPIMEFEGDDASHYSVEICRTYAGMEYSFEDTNDVCFPCFPGMSLAAMTCPPNLRMWIWCKLSHFEEIGQICFNPVKHHLAALWNMPEIVTDGFSPLHGNLSHKELRIFTDEDAEISSGMENVNLTEASKVGLVDDDLEAVTQVRGFFGLKD